MSITTTEAASEEASSTEDSPKVVSPFGEYFELGKTVVYALLIAFVLRVILFQPFTIPSASMEPTLLEGDYLIVSKFAYGWSRNSIPLSPPLFKGRAFGHDPKRGDIIVFKLPRDGHTDYIKRLVGLPGDRIQVTHGLVSINGQPISHLPMTPEVVDSAFGEPRQVGRFNDTLGKHNFTSYSLDPASTAENTGVYTVPKGCYFMMGDNRDNSLDSRFISGIDQSTTCASTPGAASPPFLTDQLGVGFVPAENLVGRADIILFSWHDASLFKPWTWFLNARLGRFFHPLK